MISNYKKGVIVYVNLTTKQIKKFTYSDTFLKSYLGGRGFCSKILYSRKNNLPETYSDSSNLIVISSGLFAGTTWPSSGRTTISVLKSPVTGLFGDGNLGGYFGPALRLSGIDALIIEGKSKNQCYLKINKNSKIKIKEFPLNNHPKLWGIKTTDAYIKFQHSNNYKVLAIGQSGSQCIFSSIPLCDDRAAGGGGTGSVMGSKNLKAIAVEYDKDSLIQLKNSLIFNKLCEFAKNKIESHPVFNTFSKYGTTSLVEIHSGLKYFPTKNWTSSMYKNWKKIGGDAFLSFRKKEDKDFELKDESLKNSEQLGCKNCPIVCSNPQKVEYETLNCLGSKIGIDDLEFIININTIYMNDAGMDVIQTTSVISALMEMYEKNISNFKIEFGNKDHIKEFLSELINPESIHIARNFKDGFTTGIFRSVKLLDIKINYEQLNKFISFNKLNLLFYSKNFYWDLAELLSNRFYVGVKGNGMSGIFPSQKNKGAALAIATASRGADHLRSMPTLATYADWYLGKGGFRKILNVIKMPLKSLWLMKSDAKNLTGNLYTTYEKIFGVPRQISQHWKKLGFLTDNTKVTGWGSILKYCQELYAVSDAISICRFTTSWRFGIGPDRISDALRYAIGLKSWNWERVLKVGERIYAIEKDLQFYYGKEIKDNIPKQFFQGKDKLNKNHFEELKDDYYQYCHYNEMGRPTKFLLAHLLQNTMEKEDDELTKVLVCSGSDKNSTVN